MACVEADQGCSEDMLGFEGPTPAASCAQQDELMTFICMAR